MSRKTNSFSRRDKAKFNAELVYLAWEGFLLYKFILSIIENDKWDRGCVVIENRSYGQIALAPIRHRLIKKTQVWTKYKRSSEAHSNSCVYDPYLFTQEETSYLSNLPIVIVVDGSYSIDQEKLVSLGRNPNRSKYPDSYHWYINYFDRLSLPDSSSMTQLNAAKETRRGINTYAPRYWHAGNKQLFVNHNGKKIKPTENLLYSNEALLSRKPSPLILAQTCIEGEAIPTEVKIMADYVKHSPGYFDFPPKEHNPFLTEIESENFPLTLRPIFEAFLKDFYQLNL